MAAIVPNVGTGSMTAPSISGKAVEGCRAR
jgi:hypothetical protein